MKRSTALGAIALLLILAGSAVQAQPGTITTGDASVWDSDLAPAPGIIPIGGSGQINGEFTIAERDGIQIALRAQDRFVGPLPVTLRGKKGRYEAAAGTTGSAADNLGTWNYDWHVDLRGTGTTLGDYRLTLTESFSPTVFGLGNPVDLTFGGAIPDDTVLYQQSWNPGFGNDIFDPSRKGTYSLKLTLKPRRGGKPLSVQIQVKVR